MFKIGDKVIAKRDHSNGEFKKGDEFIIDGFVCCPDCGLQCVYLREHPEIVRMGCNDPCHFLDYARYRFNIILFEKPASFSDCTEYRLKVSIPELVEIKELQNQ